MAEVIWEADVLVFANLSKILILHSKDTSDDYN